MTKITFYPETSYNEHDKSWYPIVKEYHNEQLVVSHRYNTPCTEKEQAMIVAQVERSNLEQLYGGDGKREYSIHLDMLKDNDPEPYDPVVLQPPNQSKGLADDTP